MNMPEYPIQEMRVLCNIATGTGLLEVDPEIGANSTNYVPKWNGSALVSGQIYESGTYIGIGNTAPSEKLHVT